MVSVSCLYDYIADYAEKVQYTNQDSLVSL